MDASLNSTLPECFIIMPIADTDGYEKGHFKRVYEDLYKPACEKAGYHAIRADDVKQTNLIHLDILQKLVSSSMAICDLSNRNPNVLFELGLRQAFDKPTVLVQEIGTPKIFDISPLRYYEYRKELKYREVIEDQHAIADAINATRDAVEKGEGVNSIVSLLSLSSPASLKELTDNDSAKMLQVVMAEMSELRTDVKRMLRNYSNNENKGKSTWTTLNVANNDQDVIDKVYAIFEKQTKTPGNLEEVKKMYDSLLRGLEDRVSKATSVSRHNKLAAMIANAQLLFSQYVANEQGGG